jgi:hypothetical protein
VESPRQAAPQGNAPATRKPKVEVHPRGSAATGPASGRPQRFCSGCRPSFPRPEPAQLRRGDRSSRRPVWPGATARDVEHGTHASLPCKSACAPWKRRSALCGRASARERVRGARRSGCQRSRRSSPKPAPTHRRCPGTRPRGMQRNSSGGGRSGGYKAGKGTPNPPLRMTGPASCPPTGRWAKPCKAYSSRACNSVLALARAGRPWKRGVHVVTRWGKPRGLLLTDPRRECSIGTSPLWNLVPASTDRPGWRHGQLRLRLSARSTTAAPVGRSGASAMANATGRRGGAAPARKGGWL